MIAAAPRTAAPASRFPRISTFMSVLPPVVRECITSSGFDTASSAGPNPRSWSSAAPPEMFAKQSAA